MYNRVRVRIKFSVLESTDQGLHHISFQRKSSKDMTRVEGAIFVSTFAVLQISIGTPIILVSSL